MDTSGRKVIDEAVRHFSFEHPFERYLTQTVTQRGNWMKYVTYDDIHVQDRRLLDLGVKFGSLEEFMEANRARLAALV